MRRIATVGLLVVLALALAMATGCTWSQKGAAAGGVVGGVVGGIVGASSGPASAGGGAAIGLAAGGLAGALAGSVKDYNEMKDKDAQIANLLNELKARDEMIAKLKKEIADLKARPPREIERIEISDSVLFASGKAVLTAKGKEVLKKAANYVKETYPGKTIIIEGHTDTDPIKISKWKSNWELGAARALAVLHFVLKESSMDPKTMSAQTFGEYQPKADNATKEGKSKNRRSAIVVLESPPKQRIEEVK